MIWIYVKNNVEKRSIANARTYLNHGDVYDVFYG